MKADVLREKFLVFFESNGHKIVESDSLVPKDDPTVLFTPAGMNQFKKQFLGLVKDFRRAASSQRCLRTDDLEKVGKTSGHHTFFEMLGNFSFGDYFKEKAIPWAWEFLTVELKINPEQLWVSVYKDDNEAYEIWKEKIKVLPEKIIKLGDKENFWPSEAKEKGPNGPCGPCSEIFFDQGKDAGCGKKDCDPSCGCGRFLEVWNLVFTQFNRKEGGILEPLPQKNIDTGMGLERLAAVMQGVHSNFETDLFKPLVKEITGHLKDDEAKKNTPLLYAVTDHIRAIVFAIYDGVLPSNDGRGYVIRKLIRKSTLHLRTMGFKKPFLYKLVPVLAEIMKNPYPEIQARRENIAEIILAEEWNFISTLDSSHKLFEEIGFLKSDYVGTAGKAFWLYDTHGIPYELTKDWLDKHGIEISEEEFYKRLIEQQMRSKQQSAMKGDVFDIKELDLGIKETTFLGYADYETEGKIVKILKDTAEAQNIHDADKARIVLDKTCFYGESGGQVGDTGQLLNGNNIFEVLDTKRLDKVIIHSGKVKSGIFKNSDNVIAKVDKERRLSIARNHTATHLLQAALRKVLGEHIKQQGSLVAPDRLRFDFTHFKDIKDDELDRIEALVNDFIIQNYTVEKNELSLQEARKQGALAFFAEKYEDKVRVVSIDNISKELCAGTHLDHTGQIGLFKIIQEGSVASGIRRIEAITGTAAYNDLKEKEKMLTRISLELGVPVDKVSQELEKRLVRIEELEKQLNVARIEALKNSVGDTLKRAQDINGIKLIVQDYPNADMDFLRKAVDLLKAQADNAIVVGTTATNFSVSIAMGVTAKGVDASGLIKEIAPEIGGSGGGREDFAQAGGNKPQNLRVALEKLKDIIRQIKI